MIAMYGGIDAGGGAELPGSVVQFTPQTGAGVESSKPLKAAGPVPPLSEFSFHHCAPEGHRLPDGARQRPDGLVSDDEGAAARGDDSDGDGEAAVRIWSLVRACGAGV